MAILNSFRIFVLCTIGAVCFYFMHDNGLNFGTSKARSKRDLKAWYKYPYQCTNTKDRYIALTFDEGPAVGKTDKILDALKWWNVKATFHFQTRYLANPDSIKLLQRAYNDGHLIGLRWDPQLPHPDKMGPQTFRDELLRQSNDLAYWMGANKYPKYLRLPWNATTEAINKVIDEHGFVATSWNVDVNDYALKDADDHRILGERIRLEAPSHRSMIVLMHDIYGPVANSINTTLEIVVNIPKTTTATDAVLVTLDQCVGDTQYRDSNKAVGAPSTGDDNKPLTPGATVSPSPTGLLSGSGKVAIQMLVAALAIVGITFVTLV